MLITKEFFFQINIKINCSKAHEVLAVWALQFFLQPRVDAAAVEDMRTL